jgi:hypothetical protein
VEVKLTGSRAFSSSSGRTSKPVQLISSRESMIFVVSELGLSWKCHRWRHYHSTYERHCDTPGLLCVQLFGHLSACSHPALFRLRLLHSSLLEICTKPHMTNTTRRVPRRLPCVGRSCVHAACQCHPSTWFPRGTHKAKDQVHSAVNC